VEKRILDEETRKKLRGYSPFSPDITVPFTPEQFDNLDASLRPIFSLRALNHGEMIQLKNNSMAYSGNPTAEQLEAMMEGNSNLIRGCVMGWVTLFDSGNGEEIEYKAAPNGGCEKSLFERLPSWESAAITEFVRKISGLSRAEELGLK
jgi:hypothetical protein